LISRRIQRIRYAGQECENGKLADGDDLEVGQERQHKCEDHLRRLRADQQVPLADTVGDYASEKRKEQERKGCRESDHPEPEGGVRKLENQPALGYVLQPGADIREQTAAPEEPVVFIPEGANDRRPLLA